MRPWYAINARDLLEQRKQGHMPEHAVSVVLDGHDALYPVLYLREDMPLDRMDWRMLVNLKVWLWADTTVPLDRVQRVARDIAAVVPSRLVVRFTDPSGDLHDVEIGSGSHRKAIPEHSIPAEHEFTWCPINLSGTGVGHRIKKGLQRPSIGA